MRAASFGFGVAFGFLLAWTQLAQPRVIREMLLLQSPYAYLIMATVISICFAGTRVVQRRRPRALLTGRPVVLERARPERRHVAGAMLFGLGWSITLACPGPVAVQIGQGFLWGGCTLAGIFVGIRAFFWNEERQRSPRTNSSYAIRRLPAD